MEFSQLRMLRPEFIKDNIEETWVFINDWQVSQILRWPTFETHVNDLLIAYGLETSLIQMLQRMKSRLIGQARGGHQAFDSTPSAVQWADTVSTNWTNLCTQW